MKDQARVVIIGGGITGCRIAYHLTQMGWKPGVQCDNIMDYFISEVSEAEIRIERAKAREMRHSPWWKRRLAEGRCYYCDKPFTVQELTMDHIVPLVRGGRSTKGNCVPACKECNNKKKHMLPIEWEEYLHSMQRGEELE